MTNETHTNNLSIEATKHDGAVGVFAVTTSSERTTRSAIKKASKLAQQALTKSGKIQIKAEGGKGSVGVGAVNLSQQ